MHTGLEEARAASRLAEYFAERARGGAGIIVTGGVAPNRKGGSSHWRLNSAHDGKQKSIR